MTVETKPAAPASVATVVATAAVTVAVGVTIAAASGYLIPHPDRASEAETTASVAAENGTASQPALPSVVLVPVTESQREPPLAAPSQAEPKAVYAAYDPSSRKDDHDDDERDERAKHRGRSYKDDHDDD